MLATISRTLLRKVPSASLQATVRRQMAAQHVPLPKMSGNLCLLAGIGSFAAVEAFIVYNDLILWGLAPDRAKLSQSSGN